MALNTRGSTDPRWLTHFKSVGRSLYLANVEIYRAAAGGQVYNAANNTWAVTSTQLFVGPARVQPVTSVNEVSDSYNPTYMQTVRVQIEFNKNQSTTAGIAVPDIRPNDRLRVTSSRHDDQLEKFIFTVTGVLNSSNAWERTLICKADIELDPTEV